jgi:hypothetical protein
MLRSYKPRLEMLEDRAPGGTILTPAIPSLVLYLSLDGDCGPPGVVPPPPHNDGAGDDARVLASGGHAGSVRVPPTDRRLEDGNLPGFASIPGLADDRAIGAALTEFNNDYNLNVVVANFSQIGLTMLPHNGDGVMSRAGLTNAQDE